MGRPGKRHDQRTLMTRPGRRRGGAGGFDPSPSLMRQAGHATREGTVRLNAPTKNIVCIGVALMAIGIIAFYGDFLDAGKHIAFWCSTGGGILLAAGATLKGFQAITRPGESPGRQAGAFSYAGFRVLTPG